jgi:hypothetical protein
MDMVGGRGTVVAREGYSNANSLELNDELFDRAGRLGLSYFVNLNGSAIFDDHVPFIRAGINAVDLFGFNYSWWHTLADTPDKVDPELVAQMGALLVDYLWSPRK